MRAFDLMTSEEVAQLLRVKVTTVRRWYREGKLPGARLGKAIRFRRDDVERWVNDRFGSEPQLPLWGNR